MQENPSGNRWHYLLHSSMTDRSDLKKAAHCKIMLSEQPAPDGDAYNFENCIAYVGKKGEIIKGLKAIMDLGITVAGGSDAIFKFVNWRQMVQVAVTRKSLSSGKVFHPELAITVEDGVWMYTINGAYQEGKENTRGSIEIGKVADYQVFDRDIFEISPEEIGESQVLMTILDGKIVYCGDDAYESPDSYKNWDDA
nr:amidohydrolase family protein [uncultured Peptoniphilus sp.]